ncbi:hypothetical protein [Marinomonas arenicola]|uniref:RNase H type-2 domain-containing protein n=1 Tax=Marinomonas arenicola TaxID=569601 RepID=A0ABU9G9G2_9GAMM
MSRAVNQLSVRAAHVLIAGNRVPKDLPCPAAAVVKGDARHAAISAAAIF